MKIREYLKKYKLITDGSFGTYYADKYDTGEMPELANTYIDKKARVVEIHKEYIKAGAKLIRTNTFASNMMLLNADIDAVKENIKAAIALAKQAVAESGYADNDIYIAGDIGPVHESENAVEQYIQTASVFIDEGIDILTFETFSETNDVIEAIKKIKLQNPDIFIMLQFSINQFGYSANGLSAGKLISQASKLTEIDAVGLNCGVGPGHMEQMISSLKLSTNKYIIALPNAGYPERIRNQIRFVNHPEYFVDKISELVDKDGVDIVGGCCGTTPKFIEMIANRIDITQNIRDTQIIENDEKIVHTIDKSFYNRKLVTNTDDSAKFSDKYLIAVELAPPLNTDDKKVLEAAYMLKDLGVDVLTFPDSPSGRTRVDSVLMAEKVRRETGMCVMPHICCRDKNAIAMRSTFLGAHINDIHNLLIITGDPIPTVARQTTKAVFNFDSVGLMNIAKDMNDEVFDEIPLTYGGAINQGRKNIDVEIRRIHKKMEAGASFFMTQPIFTKEDAQRVRHIKEETNARILCGIMPLISRKNAMFMKNEIAGIAVTDEIVDRYPENATKEQGEAVGIALAREVIEMTKDFTDGYYFTFPFNRVHMLKQIV